MKSGNEVEDNGVVDIEELRLVKQLLIRSKPGSLTAIAINQKFQYLFHRLVIIHKDGGLNDSDLTLFNDTISICMLRMTQIMKADPLFQVEDVNCDQIFEYIWQYINNSSSPLFNSLQALFNKLLDFIIVYRGTEFQTLISKWVNTIFHNCSKENDQIIIMNKNSYIILNIILKKLASLKPIIVKHENFVYNSMDLLCLDTLSNVIAKTLIILFNDSFNEKDSSVWFNSWIPYISYGLNSPNMKVVQNIQTYVLPSLFKTSPHCLTLLINHYIESDKRPEIVISLLKIGKKLSLVDPLSFVKESILLSFLTHANPTYRIDSFEVLIGGNTSINSPPISSQIFHIIKDNYLIDTFLNDEEIEIRNQFLSSMNQFLNLTFKNSMSNLKRALKNNPGDEKLIKSVTDHEGFLDWLEHHLLKFLNISSSYSQSITSLKLLEITVLRLPNLTNLYKNSNFVKLLIHNLFNEYENIRQLSLSLLINTNQAELLQDEFNKLGLNDLDSLDEVYPILHDLSGRKSEGGARYLEYIAQSKLLIFKDEEFLGQLINKLLMFISANNKIGDWKYSMHGFFKALNLIVLHWPDEFYLKNKSLIKHLYLTIHKISKEIWDYYVENILGNGMTDVSADLEDDEEELNDLNSSYWWKSIKESNSLMTNLFANLGISSQILSFNEILDAFNLIKDQLEKVNHRGTFSSIYPSFILISKTCFQSDQFRHVPNDWLANIITTIESENDKFITRRSGSIPFLISGILIGSISSGNVDSLFKPTFEALFNIAKRPYVHKHNEAYDIPQVHAFNCMKQIFQESSLAKESLKYSPQALRFSLDHFTSDNWSVRNCAVMLFSAINHRLFAGNVKGTSHYPANLFFKKFEGIDKVLEHFLNRAFESEQTERYVPLLLLLTNLSLPVDQNREDSTDKVIKSIKYIVPTILRNKSYKIREMAARCIANSFDSSEIFCLFQSQIIEYHSTKVNKNHIHGLLLMIFESIKNIKSEILKNSLKDVLIANHVLVLKCDSFNIIKVYVDIMLELFQDGCDQHLINVMGNYFIGQITDDSIELKGGKDLATSSIVRFLLQQQLHIGEMDNFIDIVELGLTCSKSYGTKVSILQFLTANWEFVSKSEGLLSTLDSILWELIVSKTSWSYVQTFVFDLFEKLDVNNSDIEARVDVFLNVYQQDPDENKRSKAIECLGKYLPALSNDQASLDFVSKCKDNLKEENTLKARGGALRGLISFCAYGNEQTEAFTRALILIISKGLYDEDAELRSIASSCISRYLNYENPNSSTRLSNFDFRKTVSTSQRIHFNELILQELLENMMSFEDIANLSYEASGPKLFEIETHNLYKNSIQTIQGFAPSMEVDKEVENGHFFRLMESKLLSDIKVLHNQTILTKGTIIQLVRNPSLNRSILITIAAAEIWLSKYPNNHIQTELGSLKSKLKFYEYAFVDATNRNS